MSSATEVDPRQKSAFGFDEPASTGVFRTPEAATVTRPPLEQQDEFVLLTQLPYREARRHAIDAFERLYIGALLDRCGGNVSLSARVAGLDRVYLHRLIRRQKLRVPRQSSPAPNIQEQPGSPEDSGPHED